MLQYSTFFNLKKGALNNGVSGEASAAKSIRPSFLNSKFLMGVLKAVVLLLIMYFIFLKIQEGHLSTDKIRIYWFRLLDHPSGLLLVFIIFLVPVNWGLEAKKWQLLAAPLVSLNIFQAARAVITGLSLGFVTPRSIGDYAGRILESPAAKREGLVGAVLLNRLSQSFVTYSAGLAGLLYLYLNNSLEDTRLWSWLAPLLTAATFAGFFVLGKGRFLLLKQGRKYDFLRPLLKLTEIIGLYSPKEIKRLMGFAFLRYGVFSLQFVLILYLSGIELPAETLLAGVAVVFMLKSVIPAFNFLSDLGVREFSALLVFSVFSVPENGLILASLLVWCLNILIPALAGSVNIIRFRLKPPLC